METLGIIIAAIIAICLLTAQQNAKDRAAKAAERVADALEGKGR